MSKRLIRRVCDGPVCQGKETVFRLDGDAVVDGQYYDNYVCVECSIAPPGKVARPERAVDEDGRILRRWL